MGGARQGEPARRGDPRGVRRQRLGFFELCLLLEEIGRSVAPVPALASLVLGALPIARFGSDAQKQRWLPGVVAGDDDPQRPRSQEPNNVDPLAPVTKATEDGEGWKLNGEKFCVPAAFVAERMLVPAKTGEGTSDCSSSIRARRA